MALLPMSPALSAALSGAVGGVGPPSAATASPPPAGRGAAATSVVALARHPSLPRVAYVSEEAAAAAAGRPPAIVRQTLLVVSRRRAIGGGSAGRGGGSGEDVLASLPLERLPGMLERFRRGRWQAGGRSAGDDRPVTLATLGPVRSITFLDRDAVFWSTCRRRVGSGSDLAGLGPAECGGVVRTADWSGSAGSGAAAVGLQFARSLAILRLGGDDGIGTADEVLCFLEGQRAARNGRAGHRPTSPPLPISESVFVYGCSDGAMRFHNMSPATVRTPGGAGGGTTVTRQSTIKSVRGPNGRNDHVSRVLCVDPAHDGGGDGGGRRGGSGEGDDEEGPAAGGTARLALGTRLVTVCASGVAYAWDVRYSVDRASGRLRDLNVLPPLARIDGMGALTLSPRTRSSLSSARSPSSSGGGFWDFVPPRPPSRGAWAAEPDAPYRRSDPSVAFDPARGLLLWTLPPGAPAAAVEHRGDFRLESLTPGSDRARRDGEDRAHLAGWAGDNGGFVKVWDVGRLDGLVEGHNGARAGAGTGGSGPLPPPRFPPSAVARLPPGSVGAHAGASAAGLAHGPLPPDSTVSITSVSPDGSRLVVHAAPLPRNVDAAPDRGGPAGDVAERDRVSYVRFDVVHSVPLGGGGVGGGPPAAVAGSHLSPDTVACSVRGAVLTVPVASYGRWTGPAAPPRGPPAGPVHAVISGGPAGGVGNNRPGLVSVEGDAVYASRLSSSRPAPAGVGAPGLESRTLLCRLAGRAPAWRTARTTRCSSFVDSTGSSCLPPPRLLPSPSGRYLCLLWEAERRYEVLHAGSLLSRGGDVTAGPRAAPSVDSGRDASSFAWVGDGDRFAVLRRRAGGRAAAAVEVYKLAEAEADAVELAAGASVAAATSVRTGTVRVKGGGDPSALFGGPSLLVGCGPADGGGDGEAYFYTRGDGAGDGGGSDVFHASATSVPCPDLLVWDDPGRTCAASYGSRVCVYLVDERGGFVLAGSVDLSMRSPWDGRGGEGGGSVVSMRFIHGVLYCSTYAAVHAIFFAAGDGADESDAACSLDVLPVSSSRVPPRGLDDPHPSSPSPTVAALRGPHILTYHSGGLLVSTSAGPRLLPLSHPLIRIGALLAAGLVDRARRWVVATPPPCHDGLASFLARRGHPGLALGDLSSMSLVGHVDLCIRRDRAGLLEACLLDRERAADAARQVHEWDRGRGAGSSPSSYSLYGAVCLYLLGKSRIESAERWLSLGAESGVEGLAAESARISALVLSGGPDKEI